MRCHYKDHDVKMGETYHYEDTANGFGPGTICRTCLYEHLCRYRPDSPNRRHLQQTFPELETGKAKEDAL